MNASLINFSFMITYIILLTTATITFIEAIRTPVPQIRHIFNLETAISLIAGYFYSVFVYKIATSKLDYAELSKMRYIDWAITTPLMLLVLTLVLSQNLKQSVTFMFFGIIVLLNYIMLLLGYLGELNVISKFNGMIFGFIPFCILFYLIYNKYIKNYNLLANKVIFGVYVVLWSLYGIVYMFDEEVKNICFNFLDLFAKCFFGLSLWVYYTKILKV
jgi:bacteriorhodopsin